MNTTKVTTQIENPNLSTQVIKLDIDNFKADCHYQALADKVTLNIVSQSSDTLHVRAEILRNAFRIRTARDFYTYDFEFAQDVMFDIARSFKAQLEKLGYAVNPADSLRDDAPMNAYIEDNIYFVGLVIE